MPSPSAAQSRDEFLSELSEDRREAPIELVVGAPEATVTDEGFELEVIRCDAQTRREVVLDPREPGELLVGEVGPGLPLLSEPALEPLLDRERIRDEFVVGVKCLADERDEVGEL